MDSIPPVQSQSQQQPAPKVIINNVKSRSMLGRFVSLLGILVIFFSIMMNFALMAAVGVAAEEHMGMAKTICKSGSEHQIVAVYEVNDAITTRTTEEFRKFYKSVANDDKVKAVILRVDSPGGGASASDEIWKMVSDLKAGGKKIVASFGPLAASGGYYISAGADEIIAEPTSITGSIGVIMTLPNLEGTMDKLGIKMTTIMSSNAQYWKDMGSPFRQLSQRDRKALLDLLNDMQARFEDVVKQGRGSKLKITKQEIKETVIVDGQETTRPATETVPFNGQIYRSADALKIGLIDSIGYFEDSWDAAARLANLDNPKVVKYHKRAGLFAEMMDSFSPIRNAAEKTAAPQILYQWYVGS